MLETVPKWGPLISNRDTGVRKRTAGAEPRFMDDNANTASSAFMPGQRDGLETVMSRINHIAVRPWS
jgi:hypothetical protein